MLTKRLVYVCLLFQSSYWVLPSAGHCATDDPQSLTVSMLVYSAEQRNVLEQIATNFTLANPSLRVKFLTANDTDYKQNSELWIRKPGSIDVLHWPWPSQLEEYVDSGLVEPISDLWASPEMQRNYSPLLKELLTVDDKQYGMPYATGYWGFYYRKSLFDKLNVTPPKTWQEFLSLCALMKENDIEPISIGLKTPWPAAAWFDYLNLRINGLEFHKRVMKGQLSFKSPEIIQLFNTWKFIIDSEYYISEAQEYDFRDAIPFLYRDKVGMMMSGNFISTQLASAIRDDIRFFPFPIIDEKMPQFEEVPTDSFIIPSASNNIEAAKLFLAFISEPDPQQLLNSLTNFIPPNQSAVIQNDYFSILGKKLILEAKGYSQYLDRDAKKEFAEPAKHILSLFIQNGNIDEVISELEALRIEVFLAKEPEDSE